MKQHTRPKLLDGFSYGDDIALTEPTDLRQHLQVGDFVFSPRDGIRGGVYGIVTKVNRVTFAYDVQYMQSKMILHLKQRYDDLAGGLVVFRRDTTVRVCIMPGTEVL